MFGLFLIESELPAIEIRHQRAIAPRGIAVRDALDLVVQPPPLLDDDDGRGVGTRSGFGVIACTLLAVWTRECDLTHRRILQRAPAENG